MTDRAHAAKAPRHKHTIYTQKHENEIIIFIRSIPPFSLCLSCLVAGFRK